MRLSSGLRFLGRLFKEAAVEWDQDNVSRLAAALAYYTTFSLAPLLVIVIAIAGFLFGQEAARGQIVQEIQTLIGRDGAEIVQHVIRQASRPGAGVIATVAGVFTLLLGATGTFNSLQDGLNHVWGVVPRPRGAIKSLVRTRILSFAMVLATGFLLLVSLVLSASIEAFGGYLQRFLPPLPFGAGLVNGLVSFVLITVLFALIYNVLPDADVPWRHIWFGSAVTALLFAGGKQLIGLYLGNSSVGSAYGAAGTLAILLIWIYFSAQVFYFGAELTQVYTRMKGRPIQPSAHATRIVRVRVEAESVLEVRRLAEQALRIEEKREETEERRTAPEEPAVPAGGLPKVIHASAEELPLPGGAVIADAPAAFEVPVEGPGTGLPTRLRRAVPAGQPRAEAIAWSHPVVEDPERDRRAVESWVDRFTGVVAGLLVGVVVAIAGTRRIIEGRGPRGNGSEPRALPPPAGAPDPASAEHQRPEEPNTDSDHSASDERT